MSAHVTVRKSLVYTRSDFRSLLPFGPEVNRVDKRFLTHFHSTLSLDSNPMSDLGLE